MTDICVVIRHIYTISSSSPLAPDKGGDGARKWARVAYACRFRRIRAIRVEMALTVTMAAIHSGSCSYDIDLQSETTGIIVAFSISITSDVCVCAIYID